MRAVFVLVVLVSLGTAVLLGALTLVLPWTGAEQRFPRALAAVLAAPLGGGRAPSDQRDGDRPDGRDRAGGSGDPVSGAAGDTAAPDVELAVRERLYGRRQSGG